MTARLRRIPAGECGVWSVLSKPQPDSLQRDIVSRNGHGFEMSIAENLFVPFQRLHHSDRFKGHGIGLATVKRAIDRHNGEIWAESSEGNGATFYFTLGDDRV
jgi:light-regulated signal transduction histidine kinase (bacteriophytochrome)